MGDKSMVLNNLLLLFEIDLLLGWLTIQDLIEMWTCNKQLSV